ncbi:MAG TPA: DUF5668 domain-containing protein [Candidatus Limnocylindrales bacterium]|nr:DUF5668 domain-containing protein [Candidatus Limnocylindrales bacterium]
MGAQLDSTEQERGFDWGGVILGGILLAIGAYWLLKDTLQVALPDIAWDTLWPLILVLLGGVILFRAATGRERRRRHAH